MRFAYASNPAGSGFGPMSNAVQKARLVTDFLNGVLVPFKGHEREDCVWCFSVHGISSILQVLKARYFCRVKYFMFTWDPPGVAMRNRRHWLTRLRLRIQDMLYAFATSGSLGVVLNLHPDFWKGRIPLCVQRKIHSFPNGCLYEKCRRATIGVTRIAKRVAVSGLVSSDKGCWEVVELFTRLYRQDVDYSLVWIGNGPEYSAVLRRFEENGIPLSHIIMPGSVRHEDSLQLLATASVAINLYRDVPSLRWNYVLKIPEFLALGVPVVSIDVPGARYYLNEPTIGGLFPGGNIEAAIDLVRAKYDRQRCVEVAAQYDWDVINRQIAAYMRKVGG